MQNIAYISKYKTTIKFQRRESKQNCFVFYFLIQITLRRVVRMVLGAIFNLCPQLLNNNNIIWKSEQWEVYMKTWCLKIVPSYSFLRSKQNESYRKTRYDWSKYFFICLPRTNGKNSTYAFIKFENILSSKVLIS